jgi:D-glycero-alpha-D-manno-heptose-7-phosphate kinase
MYSKSMKIHSQTPLRISLAGGGTDVPPYSTEFGSRIVNFTANIYVTGVLYQLKNIHKFKRREINVMINDISSAGQDNFICDLEKVLNSKYGNLVRGNIQIKLYSPVMPGSGLGASSALVVTSLSMINKYLNINMENKILAVLAYKIERELMKIPGGFQDQLSAVFGGLNLYEKSKGESLDSLRISKVTTTQEFLRELEESMILIDLHLPRTNNNIITDQQSNVAERKNNALESTHTQMDLAILMNNALSEGKIDLVGKIINSAWESKKKFSDLISSIFIDEVISKIFIKSVYGVKLLGAGGGGYLLIVYKKDEKEEVISKINELGLKAVKVRIVSKGCETWVAE